MSKVYTKTGDDGTTLLVGGRRVAKDDIRVEAYGTIDELNANVGLLAHNTKLDDKHIVKMVRHIQHKLFNIGAYLATAENAAVRGLSEEDITMLEREMDEMQAQLPPMQGFVLPGGSRLSIVCHVCRTVTRRAERRVVALARTAPVDTIVLRYLNRLSDFFFVLSRYNNISNQVEELYWDPEA